MSTYETNGSRVHHPRISWAGRGQPIFEFTSQLKQNPLSDFYVDIHTLKIVQCSIVMLENCVFYVLRYLIFFSAISGDGGQNGEYRLPTHHLVVIILCILVTVAVIIFFVVGCKFSQNLLIVFGFPSRSFSRCHPEQDRDKEISVPLTGSPGPTNPLSWPLTINHVSRLDMQFRFFLKTSDDLYLSFYADRKVCFIVMRFYRLRRVLTILTHGAPRGWRQYIKALHTHE